MQTKDNLDGSVGHLLKLAQKTKKYREGEGKLFVWNLFVHAIQSLHIRLPHNQYVYMTLKKVDLLA